LDEELDQHLVDIKELLSLEKKKAKGKPSADSEFKEKMAAVTKTFQHKVDAA